jgi:Domain of unknown function (DUF4253)
VVGAVRRAIGPATPRAAWGTLSKKGNIMVSLTVSEQELAHHLAIPDSILMQVKTVTRAPLTKLERHIFSTGETGGAGYRHLAGVFVLVPSVQAHAMVRALQASLFPQGFVVGVVATHTLDDIRIPHHYDTAGHWIPLAQRPWGLGVLPGCDPLALLLFCNDLSPTRDVSRHILSTWAQVCSFTLLGAGRDWLMLAFDTLPQDIYAFAAEVCAWCERVLDTILFSPGLGTWMPHRALPGVIAHSSREEEIAEHALIALVKRSIPEARDASEQQVWWYIEMVHALVQHLRATHCLRLWWP